ncbi:NYN domain-containing protein [Rathayibacter sp. VKM Ac-2762]|uniref:NYN domain-containing protein n=1 Tax=Rathayibacter sp. VKM Ac-2762 TaxID=2609254 RepID=UPI00132F00D1|nr:NYN domain-containing protein [Rathayibacter sp. VKM Ac-2762]QHF21693.1 NYN domain-containing protein [Rathayibacter sp. VKM Ac-2762]
MFRTSVIVDYQNVHLTAFDVFNPRGDRHDSLIHPMQFAKRAVQERNAKQRDGFEHADVTRVVAFRGLHHIDHDWEQHRRAQDQATQWRADGVDVQLRDLKYSYQLGADRKPVLDINGKKIPLGRPKEKGIDVLCALACVREASREDVDLVVLASRDTDLVPALDEVYDFRGLEPARYARIETVSWFNSRWREEDSVSGGSLKPTQPRRIWNTNLNRSCYEASVDRTLYR